MLNLAARLPRVPRACFWEITDACNLRCIHCEADAGKKASDELTTPEALHVATELVDAGCEHVNLTGGEPLLRRDWPRIADRLASRGCEVTVISNGLRVDDPTITRMVDAGVTGASISLDGDREVHDTIRVAPSRRAPSRYDAAVRAVERLVASPLRTAVITQVHRHNLDDLVSIHDRLVEWGVDVWQVQIAMPLGRLLRLRKEYLIAPSDIPRLEETLAELIEGGQITIAVADNIGYYGRHEPVLRGSLRGKSTFWTGCVAGCRVVALCSNGDVKGCPSHPRSFVVGNVRETPFAAIWADAGSFAYNTAFRVEDLVGGCARCSFKELCRAGCTSMAFAVTGTVYDNPFCSQRASEGEEADS